MKRMERVKGETVKPVAVLKLLDDIGPARASRKLGISTTTLYKARNSGVVSKSIELAATGLLSMGSAPAPEMTAAPQPARHATNGERTVVVMKVPSSKVELIREVAEKFGGEIVD